MKPVHVDHVSEQAGLPDASDKLDGGSVVKPSTTSSFCAISKMQKLPISGELVHEYCDLNWPFVGLSH